MVAQERLRIGTRGSPLALVQARTVAASLEAASEGAIACEIRTYTTTGDRLKTERLTDAGGKGLFTKELDAALTNQDIDIAVHSLKDVPTKLPPDQAILAHPKREDPREAFICNTAARLSDLPEGAVVGTASLRREAQTRAARPDLKVVPFRGNVETRLKKIANGEADATYLAMAGLQRLGLAAAGHPIPLEEMLPAPCQGIVGIAAEPGRLTALAGDTLRAISDDHADAAAIAERAFLAALDGSCRTPIAGHLFRLERRLRFVGEVYPLDGGPCWRAEGEAPLEAGASVLDTLGRAVASEIRSAAGEAFPAFEGA